MRNILLGGIKVRLHWLSVRPCQRGRTQVSPQSAEVLSSQAPTNPGVRARVCTCECPSRLHPHRASHPFEFHFESTVIDRRRPIAPIYGGRLQLRPIMRWFVCMVVVSTAVSVQLHPIDSMDSFRLYFPRWWILTECSECSWQQRHLCI